MSDKPKQSERRRNKLQELPRKFDVGFLDKMDARKTLARLMRDGFDELSEDLGGKDNMSYVKASLVERFIYLEAILSKIEIQMFESDSKFDNLFSRWTMATNTFLGLARTLGLERVEQVQELEAYVTSITKTRGRKTKS
jgi:hypothetical protein